MCASFYCGGVGLLVPAVNAVAWVVFRWEVLTKFCAVVRRLLECTCVGMPNIRTQECWQSLHVSSCQALRVAPGFSEKR